MLVYYSCYNISIKTHSLLIVDMILKKDIKKRTKTQTDTHTH